MQPGQSADLMERPSLASGLTRRVIPCLDVAGGRVVKGVRFQGLADQGDPAEAAARYAAQGADEIVFLDVAAAPEGRGTNLGWVRRAAERVFVPLTVGGGVRTLKDAHVLLAAGADKVGINSAAVTRPTLLSEIARRFGSQCAVLSVDARRRRPQEPAPAISGGRLLALDRGESVEPGDLVVSSEPGMPDGMEGWEVVTHGGRRATGLDAIAWIREGVERGAGEVLLTSIDGDGTKGGYDLDLLAAACASVPVPVIVSGGAGNPGHLAAALATGAAAVLAASIFHEGTYTVGEVKRHLARAGFPIRRAA